MSAQQVIDFAAARAKRRPRTPYWPTTPLSPTQLAGAMRQAELQDEAVLAIFRAQQCPLSPSQVHAIGLEHGRQWLITSVRRSITNLADPKCGVLVHLRETRLGPHGKPEGLWCLPVQGRAA
jgi:hypothetical protein